MALRLTTVRDAIGSSSVNMVENSGDFALGHWDNVVFSFWRARVTIEHLDLTEELLRKMYHQCPAGVATLTVMSRGVILSVPGHVRQRAELLIQESQAWVVARALVLDGDGFWASTFRSLLIAIGYVQRRQTQVLAGVDAAAQHLGQCLQRSSSWEQQLLEAHKSFVMRSRAP